MVNGECSFGLRTHSLRTDYRLPDTDYWLLITIFFTQTFAPSLKKAKFASQLIGFVAEWLGRGLQNLLQRFESARNLRKPSLPEGFFVPMHIIQNILKIVQF
jgi:hypothetical protein